MASQPQPPHVMRFGVFEADLQARELRKRGIRLKVHEQTFQLLGALLERPGEVITREELRQKLWLGRYLRRLRSRHQYGSEKAAGGAGGLGR